MKKIALLLICSLVFASCDVEDDEPGQVQVLAEVVDADLPESFEQGKVYTIDVTYLLPDACHFSLGLQAVRGAFQGPARRDIYLAGVAARPAGEADCTEEDEDLEEVDSFALRIDENQPYTFYLWTGLDENEESVYTEVVVPVVDPTSSTAGE